MLDQNTTTLLSALVGGSLSAIGGFLANYYIQSASKKDDKQKGIRNMIEKIYKELQNIEESYNNIFDLKNEYEKEKTGPLYEYYDASSAQSEQIAFEAHIAEEADKIEGSINNIDLLITLYLSPLQGAFKEYRKRVDNFVEILRTEAVDPDKALSKKDLKKISNQFQISLTTLLKKKGYSYF